MTLPVLAAAAALLVAGGGPTGLGLDVPFLSQGRLLCGGAAAAMVERFHGRRGVYSEDYQSLVRPDEGGIRTDDLAATLEARGYRVSSHEGDPAAARRALEGGLPAILLIESGRGRYHYVVLMGWQADTAYVHDPLQGPSRPVPVHRLEALQRPARYWTLVVHGPEGPPPSSQADPEASSTADASALDGALDGALDDLRAGRYVEAETRALARLADLTDAETRSLAWQLVATARLRDGQKGRALDAWNRMGEPRVDLVVIEGLERLRWPTVAARLPAEPGDLLTAPGLALGQQRLEATPGVAAARVDYRPLADGTVEVQAFVVEARAWPGPLDLVATGVDALVRREAAFEFGPLLAGSERWHGAGRWLDADAMVRFGVSGPMAPLPGIATVEVEWRRQRFGATGGGERHEEEVRRALLRGGDWVTASTRIEARAGLERWTGAGHRVRLGGTLQREFRSLGLGAVVEGDAWTGHGWFGRLKGRVRGVVPQGNREWRLRMTGTVTGDGAPRSVWDGAGLGRVRDPLLRGAGLVQEGAIGGPAFGPRLVQGSLEHAFTRRMGPVRAALVLFADGARAWAGDHPDPSWQASWGIQLEAEGFQRRAALSLGTGAGEWILSLRMGG